MNMLPSPPEPTIAKGEMQALKLSTSDIPPAERAGWLREVICREYANVDVTSPVRQTLSQDLTIYPFDSLRLSVIRSSGIGLKRRPFEPHLASHDAYLAIVLLSGDYVLEQDGNEAVLQPGDLAIFDATRPHRIHCPGISPNSFCRSRVRCCGRAWPASNAAPPCASPAPGGSARWPQASCAHAA